jgi:hypothetical protein
LKKFALLFVVLALIINVSPAFAFDLLLKNYGDVTLSGGFQAGHFNDWWDLTEADMTISFTYNATGLVDEFGGDAHAWAQLGVRSPCYGDFNPTWEVEGAGVWLATDYHWAVNTFEPDPEGSPTLDIDDKLHLQKGGGQGEGDYNLPSTPPNPGNNHRFWFDRDGVDQWQATHPLAVDGGTYNTEGTYDIVITLHATSDTEGTAYMTINGLNQGFEINGDWSNMELSPAGMTFTGDMKHLQVFFGMYGYGATHSVSFENIEVTGRLAEPPLAPCYKENIDIKPGSDPNSINTKSRGVIPVAILSSDTFFAPDVVDPDTLTFGKTGDEESLFRCGKAGEDANGDGLLDLVCHFKTHLTEFSVGDEYGYLKGYTTDGDFFWAKDLVNIVK